MNDERKQFETWVLRDVPNDLKESAERAVTQSVRPDGNYKQPLMQAFWEGWQARAAVTAPPPASTNGLTDDLLVQLFYAAQGDITQFRIKARALLEAK